MSADTLRQALDEARTSTEKLLALSDKELDAQGYDKDAIQKDVYKRQVYDGTTATTCTVAAE